MAMKLPARGAWTGPTPMVGDSVPMRAVYDLITRLGRTDVSVLIVAETGCGKELAARAIHQTGKRSDGRFVPINVAAIPENLLESELFGHTKGSFTGADAHHDGLLVRANGGTLFLDEIGDMPLQMQVKLLRALEEQRVRPVGATDEVPFDARVVAATNRELEVEIANGAFRSDLYYRLDVVRLELPPLRERGNDALLLAQYFIEHFAARYDLDVSGMHPAVTGLLLDYTWPGNVRELRNEIARAVALAARSVIVMGDLPERVRGIRRDRAGVSGSVDQVRPPMIPLATVERRHIEAVLTASDNNRTVAAEILGIDRKTLYRKLKSYGASDLS